MAGDLDADELAAALELVCATPLGTIADDVTLDVVPSDRLAEMDFELAARGGDLPGTGSLPRGLGALMAPPPSRGPAPALRGKARDARLRQPGATRLPHRSVDLLFRRGGRHFVVDHKTNWLGAPESELTVDDYAPDRLAAAMTHTSPTPGAPLRGRPAPLPTLAAARLRPETHLGGVLYLYLRGMAGPDTPRVDGCPHGVFAWRPPAALIEELSALLDGSHATANASGDDR